MTLRRVRVKHVKERVTDRYKNRLPGIGSLFGM